MRVFSALLLGLVPALAGTLPTARDYADALKSASLDPHECYRVRDVTLVRGDIRIYLTDGYLIFGKPIAGRRHAAIFSPGAEGDDAEILLMPPHRSERRSLAAFAKTPNLNEHITFGVFLFTDNTAEDVMEQLNKGGPKKSEEMGISLADKWDPLMKNLTASFEIRLVADHFSHQPGSGFFFAALNGREVGNFDVIYDPAAREQITVGQITRRNNRTYFDTWASFEARDWRTRKRQQAPKEVDLTDFRIDASLDPELHLKVITRIRAKILEPVGRSLGFEVSQRMKISEVRIDGTAVESFTHQDSLRANLLRGNDNELFLVVPPNPLEVGKTYEIEFHHEGDVITPAGKNVYFVGARGSWYPNRGADFANYEVSFRYPRNLDLVSTGDIVEDREEGDFRITRRTTASPIRFAGFNLGDYEKAVQKRSGFTVEVYANRRVENALANKPREVFIVPPPALGRSAPRGMTSLGVAASPDSRSRLHEIAEDVAGALEFFSATFGPPPLKVLTVSPIPGTFGQGFPGLLYVSTLAYLDPKERPPGMRDAFAQAFYSEMIDAHETAHQWWGNLVTSTNYQDDWLMEALANYSAIMYIEKRKGRKTVDLLLDEYRNHLLQKTEDGQMLDSVGPIIWGSRLYSSQAPEAWRIITYEKGSWILHMLRGRMGDEAFLKMLGALVARYRYKSVTTEQFHALAAEFMPKDLPDNTLESFFEQWVYGTGIPVLKLSGHNVSGKAPTVRVRGTITQSDVDEDFSTYVPVEILLPTKRSVTKWVLTSSEPVSFSVELKQPPAKVALDPNGWMLAVKK